MSPRIPLRNLYENLALMLFMSVLLILSLYQEATAQSVNRFSNDPYFPARHNFNAGFYTTYRGPSIAAPVAIGEVTFGITNRLSAGFVAGTTGTLGVLGLRMAANLYQRENFRLLYRMSIIYYPERSGTFLFDQSHQEVMPWMLSMGFLDGEWKTGNGLRFAVGMGLIETHCVDGMMDLILGRTEAPEAKMNELPFELFNTIQTSVSIPLSKRFTLRPETIFVFKGTQLVNGNAFKVAPILIYLNLVYTF